MESNPKPNDVVLSGAGKAGEIDHWISVNYRGSELTPNEFKFDPRDFESVYKKLYAVHVRLENEIKAVNDRTAAYAKMAPGGQIREVNLAWESITAQSKNMTDNLKRLGRYSRGISRSFLATSQVDRARVG
ncbi:hypothetical protein KEM60_03290 [Austwickia sp. TVS 96-490-7B]|uniref:hypothetical protein n=1 Tax=Austwickia sp. TVS 96-490-7B TaxID=2830843 RepID=UPI001C564D43|nr:hypothetical protein [Austwickia sp. TVS 96-490-7B]MBW3087060.1 hypothetical protein [Austwickia sp. TVS 96-490-7B]